MKAKDVVWIIPFLLLLSIPNISALSLTLQADNTELLEDTFADQQNANTNWGRSTGLNIGEHLDTSKWGYFKFNISNSTLDNCVLTSAEFCVYIYATSYAGGETPTVNTYLYQNQTWNESFTWNTKGKSPTPHLNSSVYPSGHTGWLCADVKNGTQTEIDNSEDNVTYIMNTTLEYGADDYFSVFSKECIDGGCGAQQAKLTLVYEPEKPRITIIQPWNTTYTNNSIEFNITQINNNLDWVAVELLGLNSSNFTNQSGQWGYLNDTLPDGVYEAKFWYNNTKGYYNTTSRWFTIDTTPPIVRISQPWNTTYNNNSISFNITAQNEKVEWMVVQINGTNSSNFTNASGEWYYLNNTLSDGTHELTLYFNDSNGLMNTTVIWITIDTLPPYYENITPESSTGTVGITHIFEADWVQQYFGIDTILLEMDSVNYSALPVSGNTYRKSFAGLGPGDHNFRWYANDTAGNYNMTSLYVFTVTGGGTGGGGGGGFAIIPELECNFTVYPKYGMSGSGTPGKAIPPFIIRIQNQNVSQGFIVTLSPEMRSYCSIEHKMLKEIPPFGVEERVIECITPNETMTGNVIITTTKGCEYGIPISIGPAWEIWSQLSNALKLFSSGDIYGALTTTILGVPIYIWIIILLVVIFLIIAVI